MAILAIKDRAASHGTTSSLKLSSQLHRSIGPGSTDLVSSAHRVTYDTETKLFFVFVHRNANENSILVFPAKESKC